MKCYVLKWFLFFHLMGFSWSLHLGQILRKQRDWFDLTSEYSLCAYGMYQTPIHIEHYRVTRMVLPALDFHGYNNYLPSPVKLINTGTTVKLKVGEYIESSVYPHPAVSGGLLFSKYIFDSLHFHWSSNNNEGSEHIINNLKYPMEMHLVHRNVKYNSTAEAREHKDGIVVLGFLFRLRNHDNGRYRPIINNLRLLHNKHQIVEMGKTFSLASILPGRTHAFYMYEGSLSTPPCSESVTWFIFPDTIPLSFAQMEAFRELKLASNHRAVQPVGHRKIFFRENANWILPEFDDYSKNNITSPLFWLNV